MKKLLLLSLLFSGCLVKREKPFIIIYKCIHTNENWCEYRYQDKNGNEMYFYETNDKYNIGDTIQ